MVNNYFKIIGKVLSKKLRGTDTYVTVFAKTAFKEEYFTILCDSSVIKKLPVKTSPKTSFIFTGYVLGKQKNGTIVHELRAVDIEPTKTQLFKACGIDGCISEEMRGRVLLNGTIKQLKELEHDGQKYVHLNILVPAHKGKPTTLHVYCSNVSRMPEFKLEEKVALLCDFVTKSKERNHHNVKYLNLKIIDAAMLNSKEDVAS